MADVRQEFGALLVHLVASLWNSDCCAVDQWQKKAKYSKIQWPEHRWLVYRGWFELVFEVKKILQIFRYIFRKIISWKIKCILYVLIEAILMRALNIQL